MVGTQPPGVWAPGRAWGRATVRAACLLWWPVLQSGEFPRLGWQL